MGMHRVQVTTIECPQCGKLLRRRFEPDADQVPVTCEHCKFEFEFSVKQALKQQKAMNKKFNQVKF